MKISLGSDHRGLLQRKFIAQTIESLGHQVDDRGTFSEESCDYPDIAEEVSEQICNGKSDRGILICGTGIGMSMAANKIDGIRAALCLDASSAALSRQHNDANVLCLPGDHFDEGQCQSLITTWLATEFEGGRHQRRVEKLMKLESKPCSGA